MIAAQFDRLQFCTTAWNAMENRRSAYNFAQVFVQAAIMQDCPESWEACT
jgi:hypothetical protein